MKTAPGVVAEVELKCFIIHSKYFPKSDQLKAHA